MNPAVDIFLKDGCGRCKYYATPQCKVNNWKPELLALRKIALESNLVEEIKWGFPTYTYNGKNIFMLYAFKGFTGISFFKGSLLKDSKKLLEGIGANSNIAKIIKYTDAKEIVKQSKTIAAYILEAVELEESGAKVIREKIPEPIPEELAERIQTDATFKKIFETLTPGRQRSYILYIGQAKQSKTRLDRIEKCIPKMEEGKGFNEY
jgi:uncharacterized protein YdeI (YjbR/CyaY-like superfamily)